MILTQSPSNMLASIITNASSVSSSPVRANQDEEDSRRRRRSTSPSPSPTPTAIATPAHNRLAPSPPSPTPSEASGKRQASPVASLPSSYTGNAHRSPSAPVATGEQAALIKKPSVLRLRQPEELLAALSSPSSATSKTQLSPLGTPASPATASPSSSSPRFVPATSTSPSSMSVAKGSSVTLPLTMPKKTRRNRRNVTIQLVKKQAGPTLLTSSPATVSHQRANPVQNGCFMWVHLQASICTEWEQNSMVLTPGNQIGARVTTSAQQHQQQQLLQQQQQQQQQLQQQRRRELEKDSAGLAEGASTHAGVSSILQALASSEQQNSKQQQKKPKTIHRCILQRVSRSKSGQLPLLKCHVCEASYDSYSKYFNHLIDTTCAKKKEAKDAANTGSGPVVPVPVASDQQKRSEAMPSMLLVSSDETDAAVLQQRALPLPQVRSTAGNAVGRPALRRYRSLNEAAAESLPNRSSVPLILQTHIPPSGPKSADAFVAMPQTTAPPSDEVQIEAEYIRSPTGVTNLGEPLPVLVHKQKSSDRPRLQIAGRSPTFSSSAGAEFFFPQQQQQTRRRRQQQCHSLDESLSKKLLLSPSQQRDQSLHDPVMRHLLSRMGGSVGRREGSMDTAELNSDGVVNEVLHNRTRETFDIEVAPTMTNVRQADTDNAAPDVDVPLNLSKHNSGTVDESVRLKEITADKAVQEVTSNPDLVPLNQTALEQNPATWDFVDEPMNLVGNSPQSRRQEPEHISAPMASTEMTGTVSTAKQTEETSTTASTSVASVCAFSPPPQMRPQTLSSEKAVGKADEEDAASQLQQKRVSGWSGPRYKCCHIEASTLPALGLKEHACDQARLANLKVQLTTLLVSLLGENRLTEMGYPATDILAILNSLLESAMANVIQTSDGDCTDVCREFSQTQLSVAQLKFRRFRREIETARENVRALLEICVPRRVWARYGWDECGVEDVLRDIEDKGINNISKMDKDGEVGLAEPNDK